MMRVLWRGLELPSKFEQDAAVKSATYGKFIVEPFERGFGTTIGNSLRRILLSSLEGAAAVSVKIAGVEHEFAQIEGVQEDVTDIILNVKGLIVRLDSDEPKKLVVEKKGLGPVTGADLKGDASIEVINKDLVLANLTTEGATFSMELEVRKGRGFVIASEHTQEEQIIGQIAVDSIFSPVTRVRYKTEDTRVGQRTNYDKLVLEIWTNGTKSPEETLIEAAKILRKHINAFVQHFEPGAVVNAQIEETTPVTLIASQMNDEQKSVLSQPLGTLQLSVRASNCLESAKLHTVGDLARQTEADLLKVRSFGKTSLREVKTKLQEIGLSLGLKIAEADTVVNPAVTDAPAEAAKA